MPPLRSFALALTLLAGRASAFTNGNFEAGNLSGWTVTYGVCCSSIASVVMPGAAPNTAGNLNRVDQGSYACELFSGTGGAGTTYARISQSDLITPSNTILNFRYAAVLDGTHSSTPTDDASMEVRINVGATTVYQAKYFYASSPAPLVDDGIFPYRHLPWTTINIDVSAYVGLTVTVSFSAYDCLYGGHSSLAYVDGFNFVPPTATPTLSSTRSFTPSITPTHTFSPTESPSWTSSPTFSHSPTFTQTWTRTPTPTITSTFSHSPSFTETSTPTPTPTVTDTRTATPTYSHSPTATPSATATPTLTSTSTYSSTATLTTTPTYSDSPTFSHTATITQTWTASPTVTPTPTITDTWTASPTFTPSPTPIDQAGTLEIRAAYPNPFSEEVRLWMVSKEPGELTVAAYNVAGEIVASRRGKLVPGSNAVEWDGRNDAGARVASGVYIVRAELLTPHGERAVAYIHVVVVR